ncbi:MAG: hypothetical protein P9L94_11830 [Candidatus Hinthialibacter antarcticus]|nr:hypothetical protein [Candidatus Hinthialibacter antarcticus]
MARNTIETETNDAPNQAAPLNEVAENAAAQSAEDKPLDLPPLRQLAASISITLAGMLFIGFLLTTIVTETKQFRALPNKGSVQTDNEGNQYFGAQYTGMRRFSYVTQDDHFASETNYLKDIGVLGTGFYIYTITNAFHWSLEFQSGYLGVLVWIPFLVIAAGCSFFYFYFLPKRAQSRDSAIFFSTLFSGMHAAVLIVFMFLFASISSSFSALYNVPVLNNGGQMIGLMLPGAFVLFMTNIFYGAIVGVILGFVSLLSKASHSA